MLMYNANIIGQATRNANHRFMVLLRHVCDTNRYLPVNTLAVNTPFTRSNILPERTIRMITTF